MNLYLIGYRGSGKTTVAPIVAEKLGWDWLDSDTLIEAAAECSIAEIFGRHGELAFRELESKIIAQLSEADNQVIALGGGAILAPENRQLVANNGKSVWLNASAESLWQRINADPQSKTQRPALSDRTGLDEVSAVLAERTPIYAACADYTIETTELSPEQVAKQIVNWLDTVDN